MARISTDHGGLPYRGLFGSARPPELRDLPLPPALNDPEPGSERTVWIDGEPSEPPPCTFTEDLSRVDALDFAAETERERRENLLLVRSYYRQPFGTFSGELPGGVRLAEGYGVMEAHDVWW